MPGKRILSIVCFLFVFAAGLTLAHAQAVLKFDDGSIKNAPSSLQAQTVVEPMVVQPCVPPCTVNFKAFVSILDATTKAEVTTLQPGGDYILMVNFDSLGGMSFPFSKLIGKRLFARFVLKGVLTMRHTQSRVIKVTDGGLNGYGVRVHIPATAKGGQFTYSGKVWFNGVNNVNNFDLATYILD